MLLVIKASLKSVYGGISCDHYHFKLEQGSKDISSDKVDIIVTNQTDQTLT